MPNHRYISDQPAQLDALGRSQFSKSLARALLSANSSDGFVVGIEGGWGSGKSSIIGFSKSYLTELRQGEPPPIVVDFNPWLLSNTGAMVEALVAQIAAAIGADVEAPIKGIKAGEKLLKYVNLIRHLKYLKYVPGITWAGNVAEDIVAAAETTAAATKATQDVLEDVKKLLPSLDLGKRKAEVADSLREFGRPIIVILDDIDRLPADEIRVLVQTIKAIADFPCTTYLLAYDRDVVAKALGYGDSEAGLSYLEKIVQVAYPIPPLFQYQLRAFASSKVKELLDRLGIVLRAFEAPDLDKAMDVLTQLLRHPRDVVRLLNRLTLSLPETHSEVNSVDVIVFEAVSQRFPGIREKVHSHPADFTQHRFRGDVYGFDPFAWDASPSETKHGKAPAWQKHLPTDAQDRIIASKACSFLFPSQEGNRHAVAENRLGIADPDRLARYFRMASLENVPEASDMHALLRNPEDLASTISEGDEAELCFKLEWLFNYAPSCFEPNVAGCVGALIEEASQRATTKGLSHTLQKPIEDLIARILRLAPPEERVVPFENTVAKAPLGIAEYVLLQAVTELGRWVIHPEMEELSGQRLVEDGVAVDAAISIWSDRVSNASIGNELAREPSLHSILYRYAQFNRDFTSVYKMVDRLLETEEGLKAFLSLYQKDSPFNSLDRFALVENAPSLVNRIEISALKEEYAWLSKILSNDESARNISEQADRLKANPGARL